MSIDIDKLNESELIDLNRRIVERLRFMRLARAHVAMLQFRIGERVTFQPEGRWPIVGTVVRYNKKSVSVDASDGTRWTVSPQLLTSMEPVPDPESPAARKAILRLPQS
jgi:hypothetical protein